MEIMTSIVGAGLLAMKHKERLGLSPPLIIVQDHREQARSHRQAEGITPDLQCPQINASVQPSSAKSAARRPDSPAQKNSSSCGGATEVPLSMACT